LPEASRAFVGKPDPSRTVKLCHPFPDDELFYLNICPVFTDFSANFAEYFGVFGKFLIAPGYSLIPPPSIFVLKTMVLVRNIALVALKQ